MLLFNGSPFWLKVCLTLCVINSGWASIQDADSESKEQLLQRIYGLLDKLSSSSTPLTASAKFSLLLSEFLIKQHMRYVPPTRFEGQLYYHLLHRTLAIKRGAGGSQLSGLEQQILDNAFQRNVLLLLPRLQSGALDANVEYENLAEQYDKLVNEGAPNRTLSDSCMRDIVSLSNCKLNRVCLELLTSEAPSYGYQRTHQVLLLYMLQHHKCALILSPLEVYELLAKSYCTEVQREQNAIRSLGLPVKYRDLYLEQVTICGLYGFNEFMNWRNVVEISSWFDNKANNDTNIEKNVHISDLALVFYINALLLLH